MVPDMRQAFTARVLAVGPGEDPMTLPCHLDYHRDDPWAVRLCLHIDGEEPVDWVFARELLAAGLDDRAGVGDVTVGPAPLPHPGRRRLLIVLSSDDGVCRLLLPRNAVTAFLDRTWRLVPAGCERLDLDAEIAALLRTGGVS